MSPQYLCVKKPLKMANDRRKQAKLRYNYAIAKIHGKKQSNFVIFTYFSKSSSKVATANPFVLKVSRKFATSLDVLVVQRKN